MAVDPTPEDVKVFVDEDDGGPVVMLNLLRFAGDAGRESYMKYGEAVGPHLERVGAEIVYAGDCRTAVIAGTDKWDAVLLVRYPSRQTFLEMVLSPEYQEITHLRTEGLEAAVLQPTSEWASNTIIP